MTKGISSIEAIIESASQGEMFILVDDEGRENEGDLIIPAEFASPEKINFMSKYGRGLICLSLTESRVDALNLPLMSNNNQSRFKTAFTISIEAKEGVTTGISAEDRSHTIKTAISEKKGSHDIASPGHVFPLRARDGGVLVRAGHTEAAVDISRLAGLNPSAVICEIMNDDGKMARMRDLMKFSKEHGIKLGTIADLISYRRKSEKLISAISANNLITKYGEYRHLVYRNNINNTDNHVFIKGEIRADKVVPVRMHHFDFNNDFLNTQLQAEHSFLERSFLYMMNNDHGVIALLANMESDNRPNDKLISYGIGAQILTDIGVKKIALITQSDRKNIIALDGFDLTIEKHIKL
jgi:3,4-dihydroxy 2-butanone 4-phosphate synthase / GTP cyclohydrolase II